VSRDLLSSLLRESQLPVQIHEGADAALAASTLALVGAGTASLHAALRGRAVLTLVKVGPLTAALGRRWVKVPHFALPNLIMGARIFPELVQEEASPEAISQGLEQLLFEGERYQGAFRQLRARLRQGDFGKRVQRALNSLLP